VLGVGPVQALASGAEVEVSGRRLLNLSTDDVLGLGVDPRVREASAAGLRRFGVVAQADSAPQRELEERLAAFFGAPSALVVNSPSAGLQRLVHWPGAALADARSGPWLPEGPFETFEGPEQLARRLERTAPPALVVACAIYPAEGDVAPLPRYCELSERHGAGLVVIDALGPGVLGATGRGALEYLGLSGQVTVQVAHLGGALAGAGAVLLGLRELVEALRHTPGSEAPSAGALAATTRALEILAAEPQRRERLFEVTQRLVDGLRQRRFDTGPTVTHRVPVWIGDEALTEQWLRALAEAGVSTRAWLKGPRSRLLLSPSATLTDGQVDAALEAFERVARKLAVPPSPSTGPAERVTLARPGSFALTTPCRGHWFDLPERDDDELEAPDDGLRARVVGAVETFTWRAAQRTGDLKRIFDADAVKRLLNRGRLR
jgi:7-keto-8-aminopelargonate synthetase-like enzyme